MGGLSSDTVKLVLDHLKGVVVAAKVKARSVSCQWIPELPVRPRLANHKTIVPSGCPGYIMANSVIELIALKRSESDEFAKTFA
jgi:hypothetical protein